MWSAKPGKGQNSPMMATTSASMCPFDSLWIAACTSDNRITKVWHNVTIKTIHYYRKTLQSLCCIWYLVFHTNGLCVLACTLVSLDPTECLYHICPKCPFTFIWSREMYCHSNLIPDYVRPFETRLNKSC